LFKDIDSNKYWAAKGKELKGCFLAIRKFWTRRRGLCLTCFSALLLPVIFMDACITTCTVGQCRWWFRWPAYSSSGSAFSLNCHFILFAKFSQAITYHSSSSNKTVWNHCPIFNTVFMWKSVWTYSVSTNVTSVWTAYNITVGMTATQKHKTFSLLLKTNYLLIQSI
jgi:hypothetical protein